jgi:hypothetical protein
MRLEKVAFVFALTAGIYLPTVSGQVANAACGEFRWSVKTLSDPARHKVDFNPIGTQVKFLRARHRPSVPITSTTPRVSRTEFRTWKAPARPIRAKLEDDNDIHLVVSVPHHPKRTMIVEFPKKSCVASPFKRYRIGHARQQFLNNCGKVTRTSWLHLAGSVTLVGVGFWDAKHGQSGIAPNGIELHPVLGLRGDCHKAKTGGGGGGGGGSCTPGYKPCLINHGGADYDCYGGGGDGPYYTKPGVTYAVTGSDPYRLDGDGDGLGCEH